MVPAQAVPMVSVPGFPEGVAWAVITAGLNTGLTRLSLRKGAGRPAWIGRVAGWTVFLRWVVVVGAAYALSRRGAGAGVVAVYFVTTAVLQLAGQAWLLIGRRTD